MALDTTAEIETDLDIIKLMSMGPMAPVANPHPIYAALRDEHPVFNTTNLAGAMQESGHQSFIITRYDDVKYVLRNDKIFSNEINQRTMGVVMGPTVIGMDGSEHLKHRTLITPSVTPRALKGDNFEAVVEKTAHDTIDAFIASGVADLHQNFCFKYPLAVFVSLLGLPSDDLDQVHRWGIDLTLIVSDPEKGLAASEHLLNFLTPIVQKKRENPGSDMISVLVTAQINGEKMSDYEVVSFLRLLVLAGAETTNHLLGTAFYALLRDAELMQRVRDDRSLVSALFHEAMRWEAPIGTIMRNALEDTEISGVAVPKGSTILCHIGAANRDERQFKNPDAFDIDRQDNEHIGFGYGRHYCAGSHLAKLEAEVAINAILDRLQDLKPDPDKVSRMIGFSFRGPESIPVTFKPA